MKTLDDMLAKAKADWETARQSRDDEVADAARTKTGMGDKYWHEERAARLRYAAVKAVVEGFIG
jgi:hypothetical protein